MLVIQLWPLCWDHMQSYTKMKRRHKAKKRDKIRGNNVRYIHARAQMSAKKGHHPSIKLPRLRYSPIFFEKPIKIPLVDRMLLEDLQLHCFT